MTTTNNFHADRDQQNQVGDGNTNTQVMNNGGDSPGELPKQFEAIFKALDKGVEKKEWEKEKAPYAVRDRYPKPKDAVKDFKVKVKAQVKPSFKVPGDGDFQGEKNVWLDRLKALKPVVDFTSFVGKASLDKFVDKSPVLAALKAACDFFQK